MPTTAPPAAPAHPSWLHVRRNVAAAEALPLLDQLRRERKTIQSRVSAERSPAAYAVACADLAESFAAESRLWAATVPNVNDEGSRLLFIRATVAAATSAQRHADEWADAAKAARS
jgi:hypothetical protein